MSSYINFLKSCVAIYVPVNQKVIPHYFDCIEFVSYIRLVIWKSIAQLTEVPDWLVSKRKIRDFIYNEKDLKLGDVALILHQCGKKLNFKDGNVWISSSI